MAQTLGGGWGGGEPERGACFYLQPEMLVCWKLAKANNCA